MLAQRPAQFARMKSLVWSPPIRGPFQAGPGEEDMVHLERRGDMETIFTSSDAAL